MMISDTEFDSFFDGIDDNEIENYISSSMTPSSKSVSSSNESSCGNQSQPSQLSLPAQPQQKITIETPTRPRSNNSNSIIIENEEENIDPEGSSSLKFRKENSNTRQTTISGDYSMMVGRYPGTMKPPEAQPSANQSVIETQRTMGSRPAFFEELRDREQHRKVFHQLNEDALSTYIYPTNLPEREYQFNIVKTALFQNTLCALPTGLGKTFIASTVMFNFYRWSKTAKIIFMAPTRPLVSQQLHACLGITGINYSDASILMGNMSAPIREREWQEKRLFFATPQTVNNDLKSGILDPKSIICLVVDEAHRSTGNQAFAEVVKFISRFNPCFRVLALTATPSSTVEGVQEIIDNLNLSKVEIRTEDSMDIQPYIHKKDIQRIKVEMSDEQKELMECFEPCVKPLLDEAKACKAIFIQDVSQLTLFGVNSARQKYMASPAGRSNNPLKFKILGILKVLTPLGYAIQQLKLQGITTFYSLVKKFEEDSVKSKSKYIKKVISHEGFHQTLRLCEKMMSRIGNMANPFLSHPKMQHLISIVTAFFGSPDLDENSRVIVFAMYRETTSEIVEMLSKYVYECRPHSFVGQSAVKKGTGTVDTEAATKSAAGMTQKEQQKVISEFKQGKYNTLVATSIGEEGLDIGEVDLIVCYDSSASPIKALQRMGRTGRKRNGKIYMLLTESEEKKFDMSLDNYKYIQKLITDNRRLQYHKVDRILPLTVNPECEKRFIEIPKENEEILQSEDPLKDIESTQRGKKISKRRKIEKRFHMPDDVQTGFVKASSLDNFLHKPSNGTNESDTIDLSILSDDDEDDAGNTSINTTFNKDFEDDDDDLFGETTNSPNQTFSTPKRVPSASSSSSSSVLKSLSKLNSTHSPLSGFRFGAKAQTPTKQTGNLNDSPGMEITSPIMTTSNIINGQSTPKNMANKNSIPMDNNKSKDTSFDESDISASCIPRRNRLGISNENPGAESPIKSNKATPKKNKGKSKAKPSSPSIFSIEEEKQKEEMNILSDIVDSPQPIIIPQKEVETPITKEKKKRKKPQKMDEILDYIPEQDGPDFGVLIPEVESQVEAALSNMMQGQPYSFNFNSKTKKLINMGKHVVGSICKNKKPTKARIPRSSLFSLLSSSSEIENKRKKNSKVVEELGQITANDYYKMKNGYKAMINDIDEGIDVEDFIVDDNNITKPLLTSPARKQKKKGSSSNVDVNSTKDDNSTTTATVITTTPKKLFNNNQKEPLDDLIEICSPPQLVSPSEKKTPRKRVSDSYYDDETVQSIRQSKKRVTNNKSSSSSSSLLLKKGANTTTNMGPPSNTKPRSTVRSKTILPSSSTSSSTSNRTNSKKKKNNSIDRIEEDFDFDDNDNIDNTFGEPTDEEERGMGDACLDEEEQSEDDEDDHGTDLEDFVAEDDEDFGNVTSSYDINKEPISSSDDDEDYDNDVGLVIRSEDEEECNSSFDYSFSHHSVNNKNNKNRFGKQQKEPEIIDLSMSQSQPENIVIESEKEDDFDDDDDLEITSDISTSVY